MKLLHALFENQMRKAPNQIALIANQKEITYQELSDYSNKIARRLLQSGIKKNTLVAVVMEKGWEQVVAVLGILKAGAAYLPIDVNELPERLSYLLEIGEVCCVLTQKKHESRLLSLSQLETLIVDDEITWANYSNETLTIIQEEADLAYVIFTSGTTGVPKGVMIDHRGAVNTILDMNHRFNINSKDRILAVSALHFDLSVYDIFGTLAAGATIILPTNDESKDPSRWTPLFLMKNVTIINCVPALIDIFVGHSFNQYSISDFKNQCLRLILLSGDWIPITLPNKIRELFGKRITIISLGGATEASIWSILYPIQKIGKKWNSIPYGKPMKNQTFYILDDHLNAVVADEIGELYIGGIGLAKGYWRDQQRTLSAFISHPDLGRLYKTGDLGRYLPDGDIEFLGRLDYQVKINGHRIELSAIESCLLEYPSVSQACVVAAGNNLNKYLAAYLVLRQDKMENNLLLARVQIAQWHKIHDDLGDSHALLSEPTFNIQGWISSFTQKPMSPEVMQEWVQQTVARILSLNPKKILEVGCGLGLLLFQLAPHTLTYEGMDYSQSAVRYIKEHIHLIEKKIGLQLGEAKSVGEIYATQTFDMVILNSIIQYFPTIDYFIDVLNQSINLTEAGGYIFIGDVCSLVHLPVFHAAIQWKQSAKEMSWLEWRAMIDYYILQEEELWIDHRFFYAFQKLNPRISAVDIQIKRGCHDSEMNLFRYDVILYVDHHFSNSSHNLTHFNWYRESLSLNSIRILLEKNDSPALVIQDIPNKRVVGLDESLLHVHYTSCQWTTCAEKTMAIAQEHSIEPEELHRIGEALGYTVSITWAEKNPLNKIDVLFIKNNTLDKPFLTSQIFSEETTPELSKYSNMPLQTKAVDVVLMKLKKFLSTKLPAYMVPSVFMTLDALPMSINGKIDRQALPPARLNFRVAEYIPPSTELETKLSKIWSKILKVDKIGINDNFYELGGTSLLAVLMIAEIQEAFIINLNVGDIIFHGQSIHALSILISQKIKLQAAQEKQSVTEIR